MTHLRVGLVQTDSGSVKETNLDRAEEFVREAARRGAEFVALPENVHARQANDDLEGKHRDAESIPGPFSYRFGALAAELGIHLAAGSIAEAVDGEARHYNTSLLFAPDGSLVASYRKVHLFDVTVGSHVVAQESASVLPGQDVVVADTTFGRVGMSICYDLRFPELFRAQAHAGALMSLVPANFTMFTGKDHWEVLLRARAIENGIFIVACGQTGGVKGSFQAYGRSMVIDPWGVVLATATDTDGVTICDIDLEAVAEMRRRIPTLQHTRSDVYGQLE